MKTLWIIAFIAFALTICIKIAVYIHTSKYHKKQIEHLEDILYKTKYKQITLNHQIKVLQLSEDYQKLNLNALYSKMYEMAEAFL